MILLKPLVKYGSVTRTRGESDRRRIKAAEIKMLRSLAGYVQTDRQDKLKADNRVGKIITHRKTWKECVDIIG
jgi:hypothetical protein